MVGTYSIGWWKTGRPYGSCSDCNNPPSVQTINPHTKNVPLTQFPLTSFQGVLVSGLNAWKGMLQTDVIVEREGGTFYRGISVPLNVSVISLSTFLQRNQYLCCLSSLFLFCYS